MSSLLQQFWDKVRLLDRTVCWRFKNSQGVWEDISWREVGDRVQLLSKWLLSQGLTAGDRVVIWGSTRWEWSLSDIAVIEAGGVVVPVYHTLPLSHAAHIVNESGSRFLMREQATMAGASLALLREACPALEHIILWEGDSDQNKSAYPLLHEVLRSASADQTENLPRDSSPRSDSELVSIVYTSGTTGTPKGVELTMGNFSAEVAALHQAFPLSTDTTCLMFLPLAHIVARAVQWFQLTYGMRAAYAEGINAIGENMNEVSPDFFVAVPRVFEKMQARIEAKLNDRSALQRRIFRWAQGVGLRMHDWRRIGRQPPWSLRLLGIAAGRILRPVHDGLGGKLRMAVSGGAPLSREVAEYFAGLGLPIYEGYGLTETCAAVTLNTPEASAFGSVGKAVRGAEVKIAEDGEILVRGGMIFRGYYQRPEDTAEVLRQGWFHTGDIGEWSAEGFLIITDRKKDLIKTSGGKYIAPQPIEAKLKASPFISDGIVHGDKRKFLTALLTLDRASIIQYAKENGLQLEPWERLVNSPKILALLQSEIDRINRELASFETIKRFRVLAKDFSVENGELTPTLKVKRKELSRKYQRLFDDMYQE